MGIEGGPCERIRSALFVDFDNIYSRLEEVYGEGIARSFGCNPDRWIAWIERHATGPCVHGRPCPRKLLVRRCYMNPKPKVFRSFRPRFTQAAFEVIDCPPLTDQEKTSTDMHLVIDVLDALTGPVHLDEFIILSGDADFTPLLVRLRKHDRSTAIFCVGPASAAYKAASDSIIPVNEFISQALGMSCEARRNGAPAPEAQAAPPTVPVAPAADSGATPTGTSDSGAQAEAAPAAASVSPPGPPPGSKGVGPHKAPRPYRRPPDKPGSPRLGEPGIKDPPVDRPPQSVARPIRRALRRAGGGNQCARLRPARDVPGRPEALRRKERHRDGGGRRHHHGELSPRGLLVHQGEGIVRSHRAGLPEAHQGTLPDREFESERARCRAARSLDHRQRHTPARRRSRQLKRWRMQGK